MSWLPRSLTNSLTSDQNPNPNQQEEDAASTSGIDPNRGVKEDLSELTETLTRQFWGVASFLSPPPSFSSPSDPDSTARDESPRFEGIRNDFVEIGGKFRSGISKLSSNLIPFGSEEEEIEEDDESDEEEIDDKNEEDEEIEKEDDDQEEEEDEEEEFVVGVTEEVMTFARNIAMHPETWLDFPLFTEFEDTIDFEMSHDQQEHAQAVVNLEPRLAALRIELCPAHMTEGCFWKIYFVLLHSRLSKDDAKLLATPQIDEARAMLLQKLQNKSKSDSELSSISRRNMDYTPYSPRRSETNTSIVHNASDGPSPSYLQNEKDEVETIDKSAVIEEIMLKGQQRNKDILSHFSEMSIHDYDDDDWLEEEEAEVSKRTIVLFGNEEDVSFSDLEDEDELKPPLSSKISSSSSRR